MHFDISNFTIAAPLLALAAGALVVLLFDLLFPAKSSQAFWYVAALGSVALAGWYLVPLWDGKMVGFNGALVMDRFGLVYTVIMLITAFLTVLLSFGRSEEDKSGYLALVLWGTMGMIVMVASGSLMTIFLGLELLSLALYVVVAFDPKRPQAREAALKYFFLGSTASAFLLFGFALVYGATGTMDLAAITKAAVTTGGDLYFKVGIGLSVVGMAFKLALVPFHSWAPDVYEGAPTPITAYMSVGTKAAAFGVLARFLMAAVPAAQMGPYLFPLSVAAAASMLLGSTVGIWQKDLKRLMAYSGIAHAGYLVMAIPGLGAEGMSAAAYYLASYAFTAMGIFAIIAILEHQGEEGSAFEVLQGLYWRHPVLGGSMALFMFALAGMPPTGGFVGKFMLAIAAVHNSAWLVLIALITSTGISAFVYLKVIGTVFKNTEAAHKPRFAGAADELALGAGAVRWALNIALAIAVIGTLWLGILPGTVTALLHV